MKKASLLLGGAVLCLALWAGAAFAVNAVLSRTHTAKRAVTEPVRSVVIKSDAGDVELVRGARGVQLTETQHYVLAKPRVTHAVRDGVLRISSSCGHAFVLDCDTHLRVELPSDVAVTVDTSAGSVHAIGLDSGDVRVKSDAGDIDLDFARTPVHVEALTSAGSVGMVVPAGTYAVDAHTDAGDNEVHGVVQDEAAPHSIRIRTNAGDVSVAAR
jgi:hypothetical protein